MSVRSFLIGLLVLSSPCIASTLPREPAEEFFDYAFRVKLLELAPEETESCIQFLAGSREPLSPYLETLQAIYREQLILRMGSVEISQDFLEEKICRQMRIFLKDKLGCRKPIDPDYTLAERAKWDPHFHGSSLFSDHFPVVRLYLPNFVEAYTYLKYASRTLEDRDLETKKAMEERAFATITEACVGRDSWKITHAGKQIIVIFSHQRTAGGVVRDDVTGYDLCGAEDEDHYHSLRTFFESIKGPKVIRVHMGETMIPSQGKEHVRLLLDEAELYYTSPIPLRIGHGTHIGIEEMIRVVEKGYYIESCMSSNKRTGVLDKRSDYPLGVMLLLGVNVVIGTDGGRLYSTTLPEEYTHATRNLEKFHSKLKTSDELVTLTNGDVLCYKRILSLLQEEKKQEALEHLEDGVTYRELGEDLDPAILERISTETLVKNANTLLQECYPMIDE